MTPEKRKTAAAWLSVLSNTTLIIMKIVVGVLIGSVSVISEAIHSGVDLVAAVIALFAVKEGSKPADEKHPFGHGKFENLSGAIEALLIFVAAGWIVYEAVSKIIHPRPLEDLGWGVGVMLVSSVANWFISANLFRVGRQTDSIALQADAWHLRTDVYTSAGVMAGLGLIWLGDIFFPDLGDRLHIIDPLAAILVALLIVRAAWHLTLQSARDLMDVNLPSEEVAWIRLMLTEFVPRVHGFHRMKTRKAGANRFVEFHIFVDENMTVRESHALCHELGRKIAGQFAGTSVTIHVEPCMGNCDFHCRSGCLLDETQQAQIRRVKNA